jgi:LmbE family N-acetylglucosaminyl deacetylase
VTVAACGLGRTADQARRRRELVAATTFGGFELVVHEPPVGLSTGDDLDAARRRVVPWLVELMDSTEADLVVGPQLHDVHPAHEAVARAIRDAVPHAARPPMWWSWGIWADLRRPTLLLPCAPDLVERALAMLRHHEGEVERNDYVAMVRAAGRLNAIRGVERVQGFGTAALPGVEHAELLTELGWVDGCWRFGIPRVAPTPDLLHRWDGDATEFVQSKGHSVGYG